jgi:Phytanoyl-CoA dioxygenase (PhyH)
MRYEPEAWRKAYQDNGFVVVQDLLDPATLSRMRDELTRIIENLESLPSSPKEKRFFERDHMKNNPQWYAGILTSEECGLAVRQIADLALFDASFAELICYPLMLDVLETLFESSEFSFKYLIGRRGLQNIYERAISNLFPGLRDLDGGIGTGCAALT